MREKKSKEERLKEKEYKKELQIYGWLLISKLINEMMNIYFGI